MHTSVGGDWTPAAHWGRAAALALASRIRRGPSFLKGADPSKSKLIECAGPTELEPGKETIIVNPTYFVTTELIKEIDIPQRGILSRTLYDDNDVKVVLFGFSAGHELSAHTAPMPAALYFLEGEADLTLGSDTTAVKAGAFAHMPPYLNHAIVAKTPLVMLLIMMKGLKREKDKVSTE